MKHALALLAASTAISTFAATAAFADPDVVAGVSVGGVGLTQSYEGEEGPDIEGYTFNGFVSGAYSFTPVLGVQGDVVVRYYSLDAGEEEYGDASITSLDGALHAFYRDPESFLLGGFVQLGQDEFDTDGPSEGGTPTIERSIFGVEGQAFFDDVTVYGQIGAMEYNADGTEFGLEGWFIRGEIRYFLTPDFKIEAHAGRRELTYDIPEGIETFVPQIETVNVGFGAEYKFADLPLSVIGQYDYNTTGVSFLGDQSVDSHRVTVGLKFNLGEQTLKERDRNGASLKPVEFGGPDVFTGISTSPP